MRVTIEHLAHYPAEVLAFPHERIWRGKAVQAIFARALGAARRVPEEVVAEAAKGRDHADLEQVLFDRFYCKNLRI